MRIVLVLAFWLLLTGTANAAIVEVTRLDDPAGNGNCPTDCSLRQAVEYAQPGDTVKLAGGPNAAVYSLTRGTTIEIAKNLTIEGDGPNVTAIDGQQNILDFSQSRILKTLGGTVRIANLTLQNG